MQKRKKEKLGRGLQLSQEENYHWTEWKNMNTKNYLKVLEEVIERAKKELRDISWDVLFLQIENARYYWSIEALEFYYKNNFYECFY